MCLQRLASSGRIGVSLAGREMSCPFQHLLGQGWEPSLNPLERKAKIPVANLGGAGHLEEDRVP